MCSNWCLWPDARAEKIKGSEEDDRERVEDIERPARVPFKVDRERRVRSRIHYSRGGHAPPPPLAGTLTLRRLPGGRKTARSEWACVDCVANFSPRAREGNTMWSLL